MDPLPADVDELLHRAISLGGSDVLLTFGAPPMVRVQGALRPLPGLEVLGDAVLRGVVDGVLDEAGRARYALDKQVDLAFSWRDQARIRANAFTQQGHPALSLRIIPSRIPSVDEVGVPPTVRDLLAKPQGLLLVTGPTGSGKSTTQAALIDLLNRQRPLHVLTLEDPIEYVHQHRTGIVNQREIGRDCADFAQGLRAALREDPDVVLVGEMRDPESIAIALTVAETGHLVLSTLHTNDAPSAVDRIIDVFPADRQDQVRVQLAGSLLGVVAQRLVPRVGGGVVVAWELLVANHAVRNLIREGKTQQLRNAITMGHGDGMFTLEQSLASLVGHGIITHADAVTRAMVPAEVPIPSPSAG